MSKIFIKIIDFYQSYLSFDTGILTILAPGGACKYPERCSEYVKRQVVEKGFANGLWLGFLRFLTCR